VAKLVKPIITRYLDADGRQVPKGTRGARHVRQRARKWYAVGVPGWSSGKRVPLAANNRVAQRLLDDMVAKALAAIHGTAPPSEKYRDHDARPLAQHLDAYRGQLALKGSTAKHVKQTVDRIRVLAAGCGFKALSDIDAEDVVTWLSEKREDGRPAKLPNQPKGFRPGEVAALLEVTNQGLWKLAKRAGVKPTGRGKATRYDRTAVEMLLARAARGASVQTCNFYLSAFKGFCRWLEENDRIAKSPSPG
jgi:hypothetical protein